MQNDLFFSFSFSADFSSKASEVNYQIFCQNNLDADQSSQKHTNSFIFLFALPLALCCAAYSKQTTEACKTKSKAICSCFYLMNIYTQKSIQGEVGNWHINCEIRSSCHLLCISSLMQVIKFFHKMIQVFKLDLQ